MSALDHLKELKDKGMTIDHIEKTYSEDPFYSVNSVKVGNFSVLEDVADTTITLEHTGRLETVYATIKDDTLVEITGPLYKESTTHRLLALVMGVDIPIKKGL